MQRWTSVVVGVLAAAGIVAALVWTGRPGQHSRPSGAPSASASASAAPTAPAATAPQPAGSGETEDLLGLEGDDWSGDGGKPLPNGAPSAVGFGVILFTYQGAQLAPASARSKDEALKAAKAIIEDARKDFSEAVKKGDKGSMADVGHIQRGVLEPEIEFVLFSLEKGAVHPEPLDTPRGYWVLKRTD